MTFQKASRGSSSRGALCFVNTMSFTTSCLCTGMREAADGAAIVFRFWGKHYAGEAETMK
jgi:hypothetical protein